MRPVLVVPAALREEHPVEHRGVVGAEPGEERQVVRAGEDAHRVELQHAEPVDGRGEAARGDGVGMPAPGALPPETLPPGTLPPETLRAEREAARGGGGQVGHASTLAGTGDIARAS